VDDVAHRIAVGVERGRAADLEVTGELGVAD
jgi:hypothetical protein